MMDMTSEEDKTIVIGRRSSLPEESEIKIYFSMDQWDRMSDYDKDSYKNIFHNYKVMTSLGLRPMKPKFMLNKIQHNPTMMVKRESNSINHSPPKKQKKLDVDKGKVSLSKKVSIGKCMPVFSDTHKSICIRLHNLFSSTLRVYKNYERRTVVINFQCFSVLRKRHDSSLEENILTELGSAAGVCGIERAIEEQDTLLKIEPSKDNKVCRNDDRSNITKLNVNYSQKKETDENIIVPLMVSENKKKKKKNRRLDSHKDKNDSNKIIKNTLDVQGETRSSHKWQFKKPCRSVQTQTVPLGVPIQSSVLVFVSSLAAKKISQSSVNDDNCYQYLKLKEKKEKSLKQLRKNSRCVQTQTVDAGASITDSKLVFFHTVKSKKQAKESKKVHYEVSNQQGASEISENFIKKDKSSHYKKRSDNNSKIKQDDSKQGGKDKNENIETSTSVAVAERRYPKRSIPVHNYLESDLLQDDDYLFCDLCNMEYEGDCPEHGPYTVFVDNYAPVTGEENRAERTTPLILQVAKSVIPGAGSGVWTTVGLPGHARFGPYEGEESDHPDLLGYSWTIMKNKRVKNYIAAKSPATSNWMRFVNCARHETEQNLMAFQYKGKMYYRTLKPVPPKNELFVWYGKEYAEKLGISMESFRSPDTSHLKNLVFPCKDCNATFTSPLYLQGHQKACRSRFGASVKVEPGRVPQDIQSLAKMCDGKKTYCCPLCQYKTSNNSHIRRHLMTHTGERAYKCEECGKGFTQARDLLTHKLIHSGDKPFRCTQCAYKCTTAGSLKTHVTRRHSGEKVLACSKCSYKCVTSSQMKRHRRTHTGEKPYSCDKCGFRAAQSIHLRQHMRIHTGEKPYSCDKCGFRAAQGSHLTQHMRSKHGYVKPATSLH